MKGKELLVERKERICTLTLNRPEKEERHFTPVAS